VAQIRGVPDDTSSLDKAMAAAAIPLATEFREEDRRKGQIARRQLAKAGKRLAAPLNQIWPSLHAP